MKFSNYQPRESQKEISHYVKRITSYDFSD